MRIVFEQEEDASTRSFFSEIISSISDVRFSHDGRYILSRDYLTVKIWDVNMEKQPIKTIPIHEHLRPRLCDTYENDSIFDKFEVVFSGDAENVMTGSYNNNFMIYPTDPNKETEIVLQADKSAFKAKKVGVPTPINKNGTKKGNSRANSPAGAGSRMRKETDADQIDFNKKILHMTWHPFEDSIAIAATNNVRQPQDSPSFSLALLSSYSKAVLTWINCHSSLCSLHCKVLANQAWYKGSGQLLVA
jgi:serine/threonine-protein phosphatase 2A regulatory subunit B